MMLVTRKKEVVTILSLLLSISALVTPLATKITLPTSSFSSSKFVCVQPRDITPLSYHTSLCHGSTPLNHHREEGRQSHEATEIHMDVDTTTISSSPSSNNAKTRTSSLSSSSRKSFLRSLSIGIIASQGQPAWGLPAGPIVTNLENGMLESRVVENVLSPPQYGMEANDISFPSYFTGVWNSNSTTKSIQAPCGIPLFGGNATYTRAMTEVGTSITYRSRFLPSSSSNSNDQTAASSIAIADREFNVAEITKASMGTKAVMDIPIATPNKLSAVLSPNGADGMIVRADLLTLARREESVGKREFHCSEVVRQIVSPLGNAAGGRTRSSLVKEVETTSLYTALPGSSEEGDIREIRCLQRTATFLVPSQEDPMALRMWEASRGRPIDIRFYDVVYTKQ